MTSEPNWRKSTRSSSNAGNCVEVADNRSGGRVLVRDSKDQAGPNLAFTPAAWRSFIAMVGHRHP